MAVQTIFPSSIRGTFEFPDDSKILSRHSSALFGGAGMLRDYQFGERGYFEAACSDVMPSKLRSRSPFLGYELLIADGDARTCTTAALRGPFHDVLAVFGGPAITEDQVRATFAGFTYADRPDGMVMLPYKGIEILTQDVTLVVEGRGIVTANVGAGAIKALPSWAGTASRKGEIWKRTIAKESTAVRDRDYNEYFVGFSSIALQVTPGSYGDDSTPVWANWLYELNASAS